MLSFLLLLIGCTGLSNILEDDTAVVLSILVYRIPWNLACYKYKQGSNGLTRFRISDGVTGISL